MNCFYHPTVVSVGTCKSCYKGLCPDCAVEVGKGLACKGRCEEDVKELNLILTYSAAMVDKRKGNARGGALSGGYFYVALGLIFTLLAAIVHDAFSLAFALPFGLIMLTMGFLTIRRARNLPN